jgi:hypothetical protein
MLKGFRSKIDSFILGFRKEKPVIQTQWGPVSEDMRLQAAMNMIAHPEVRIRVEEALAKKFGSVAQGLAEARRRYPEVYASER